MAGWVDVLLKLVGREDSGGVVSASSAHVQPLGLWMMAEAAHTMRMGALQVSAWVHTAHFLLSSNMCHTLMNRSDINICHFNPLIIFNLKLFRNNLWWSLDSKRFLWAFVVYWANCRHIFGFFTAHFVVVFEEIKIVASFVTGKVVLVIAAGLLKCFIYLHWRHQLALSQKRIHLLDKF